LLLPDSRGSHERATTTLPLNQTLKLQDPAGFPKSHPAHAKMGAQNTLGRQENTNCEGSVAQAFAHGRGDLQIDWARVLILGDARQHSRCVQPANHCFTSLSLNEDICQYV
jgi:hypothetical protein